MATGEYAIHAQSGSDLRDGPERRAAAPPVRFLGLLCAAGGAIAVVGVLWSMTVHPAVTTDRMSYPFSPAAFRLTEVIWTLTHLLTFFGALGLVRTGLAGAGRTARIGRPLALAGMALLVPAELAFVLTATSAEAAPLSVTLSAAIGVAALVAGVGLTLLGVAVLRERRWTGRTRWIPLLAGVYELVVMTAVGPLSGPVFEVGIAGWNVCLALLGLALVAEPGRNAAR